MRHAVLMLTIAALTGPALGQSSVYPDLPIGTPPDLVPLAREQGWAIEVASTCDNLPMEDGALTAMWMLEQIPFIPVHIRLR